jgi:hypothetical protein
MKPSGVLQFFGPDEIHLLAFAQHMARTAQSQAARRQFETFLRQEMQRLAVGAEILGVSAGRAVPRDDVAKVGTPVNPSRRMAASRWWRRRGERGQQQTTKAGRSWLHFWNRSLV